MYKNLNKLSNKELVKEYHSQKQLVEDVGCYGVRDIIYLIELENEVAKRENQGSLKIQVSYNIIE